MDAGIIPVERGAAMTDDDVLRRFVINRVMCLLRLDLAEVGREVRRRRAGRHRGGPRGRGPGAAGRRARDLRRDVLRVTPLGQLLVRNVAMLFDAYLKREGAKKQFSQTV